ncbi:MAG: SxtJ family membrane protein [Candidatus Eisenbacteria bacterium]
MAKDNAVARRKQHRKLRNFGLTVGIAFGVLAGLLFWRDKAHYVYFAAISVAFLGLGLLVPAVLKPVEKAWMTAARAMGWFMTRVILTILFFAMFTPMGFIARLFGKDFIGLKMDESAKSYWIYREARDLVKEDYEKQF